MPEGMVAIDQMPDGAVQAEEDVTAIERVLEGRGAKCPLRRAMLP